MLAFHHMTQTFFRLPFPLTIILPPPDLFLQAAHKEIAKCESQCSWIFVAHLSLPEESHDGTKGVNGLEK